MRSPVRISLRCWQSFPQPVRSLQQSRLISHLEVERKFLPAADFHRRVERLIRCNFGERSSSSNPIWSASRSELIRDKYFDCNGALARKGIWIRYRFTTSKGTKDAESNYRLPADGRWDAKVRLGGDFVESQFEEHEGEQSIKKLLAEHVPGTMLEDLQVNADLETTRTMWSIPLRDGHLLEDKAPGSDGDYLTIALDHVVSLGERTIEGQRFEHVVGEIELTKRVNAVLEDEGFAEKRKMELDRMRTQIEDFMNNNPGLFSKLKPKGKLSAYFDWVGPGVASVVRK